MRFSIATAIALSSAAGTLAKTVSINVGVGGLNFDPTNATDVQKDDVLQFNFVSNNHSVVQSTFTDPCTQKENGINSGFQNIEDPNKPFVWNVTVNDTTPLWFFCSQTIPKSHCTNGMVLAINPTVDSTFVTFKNKATNGSTSTSGTGTSGAPSPNNTSGGGSGNGAFSHSAGMNAFSLLSVVGIAFGLML
ncbi:hypothetical protein E1B28_008945 [Marasmius oreades]|uniref:Cupredoxin n=1 Tax=Marasmius oreades TaxID=181124 RepID=A0A9P7S015_9AGAR|nr:uncharacterized protein E1B28_008945 [Marasmius oreades]KAG7092602.1 hypothetical protein E1B28_008945 [Marasmius oreades]